MDPWCTPKRIGALISRITAFTSSGTRGRPALARDLNFQKRRNPVRCHRTTVSGRTMQIDRKTPGCRRYSAAKKQTVPLGKLWPMTNLASKHSHLMTEHHDIGFYRRPGDNPPEQRPDNRLQKIRHCRRIVCMIRQKVEARHMDENFSRGRPKPAVTAGPTCGCRICVDWLVEPRGIEPLTSTLRTSRSPN